MANPHPYQLPPGPGRPKGLANKTTIEVKECARLLVEDEEYVRALKLRLLEGTAPHMETLLWHYAYGKPKDTVQIDGKLTLGVERVMRVIVDPGAHALPAADVEVIDTTAQPALGAMPFAAPDDPDAPW